MDQRKKKILKGIEQFGFIKLDADNGFCYGYLNKQDWLNALKELKEEGCINYSDIKEGIFKGEPNGKITITNYGKNLINEYKFRTLEIGFFLFCIKNFSIQINWYIIILIEIYGGVI